MAQADSSCTLTEMTLVHRPCTLPAKRAFGYALRNNYMGGVRGAFCSPLFGTWTKRAYILYPGSEGATSHYPWSRSHVDLVGKVGIFNTIYARCETLYRLPIEFEDARDDDVPRADGLLGGVSKMVSLRELAVDVGVHSTSCRKCSASFRSYEALSASPSCLMRGYPNWDTIIPRLRNWSCSSGSRRGVDKCTFRHGGPHPRNILSIHRMVRSPA